MIKIKLVKFTYPFLKKSPFFYRLRLELSGSKYHHFFKIVVVNSSNRIVSFIGTYTPHKISFYEFPNTGKLYNTYFFSRTVCLNISLLSYWLEKGLYISPFLCFLFSNFGFFKLFNYNLLKKQTKLLLKLNSFSDFDNKIILLKKLFFFLSIEIYFYKDNLFIERNFRFLLSKAYNFFLFNLSANLNKNNQLLL